jgi:hypothetical protein
MLGRTRKIPHLADVLPTITGHTRMWKPTMKGDIMFIRKLLVLALGLALAIAALAPASALAKAKGTDRPVKGSVSGTGEVTVAAGTFTLDSTGVASHVGKFTRHAEGTAVFPGPDTSETSGTFTVVAANGDKLYGTFTGTGTGVSNPAGHTDITVGTFTGGTGRFAGASGTVTEIAHVTPLSFDGTTQISNSEGTFIGQISY